ncbi:MAG: GIY-YIG nuclease family protein [Bacteroidota bacterium]|nr:GIY-YIG nuclease family protein [Bacteroidota bacterium]
MYAVYILYAEKYQKTYVGFTSDLNNRLLSHNSLSKKGYTYRFRPWRLIHCENFESKIEAMKKEKYFKSGIGRKWITENWEALIKNS